MHKVSQAQESRGTTVGSSEQERLGAVGTRKNILRDRRDEHSLVGMSVVTKGKNNLLECLKRHKIVMKS